MCKMHLRSMSEPVVRAEREMQRGGKEGRKWGEILHRYLLIHRLPPAFSKQDCIASPSSLSAGSSVTGTVYSLPRGTRQ